MRMGRCCLRCRICLNKDVRLDRSSYQAALLLEATAPSTPESMQRIEQARMAAHIKTHRQFWARAQGEGASEVIFDSHALACAQYGVGPISNEDMLLSNREFFARGTGFDPMDFERMWDEKVYDT